MCYINSEFSKHAAVTQSAMTDTLPYVDPQTGLRRYKKVEIGDPQEFFPLMARYTRVKHTMNVMWEMMDAAEMEHMFPMQAVRETLMDGMLSNGVAGIVSAMSDALDQQHVTANTDGVVDQPDQKTGLETDQTTSDSDRPLKRHIQMTKFDLDRIYPDYKTLCTGLKLQSTPAKTSTQCPQNERYKYTGFRYPPVKAFPIKKHVTPNGIYDKTTRHKLTH